MPPRELRACIARHHGKGKNEEGPPPGLAPADQHSLHDGKGLHGAWSSLGKSRAPGVEERRCLNFAMWSEAMREGEISLRLDKD